MITIDVKIDDKDIKKIEKDILKNFDNKGKQTLINNINNKIGPLLKADAEANFRSRGKLYKEPWKPLAPSTIETKRRKGFPLTPLVATGRLKNGFDYLIDKKSGSVVLYNSAQTRDGLNLASIHDQGTSGKRYSPDRNKQNRKSAGVAMLTRKLLQSKGIIYPKQKSSVIKPLKEKEIFKEFRFRNPLDGSVTSKKINLKEYSKYSQSIIQEDKLTVRDMSRLMTSGRKSKPIRSSSNAYSAYKQKYSKARKLAESKYKKMSEKSRNALTSYTLPSRILFKIMDYYDEKIMSIVEEETLKLLKT